MSKLAIAAGVGAFFLWIIYLRMQKDEENLKKRRQSDEKTKER